MKKIVIILFLFVSMFLISSKDEIIIPNSNIRYRILANSNEIEDQLQKRIINKDILNYLDNLLKDTTTKEEASSLINNNISKIENIVSKYTSNYEVNFSKNYFPKKSFKNIIYKEGYYDSLVINLGQSKGNNFWCVVFPPLCLIDSNTDDVKYTTYIKEIINNTKNS